MSQISLRAKVEELESRIRQIESERPAAMPAIATQLEIKMLARTVARGDRRALHDWNKRRLQVS